jgi:hypothetical protein
LLLTPYAQVLTPSMATPALFKQYSSVLATAAKKSVFHNDISPDNLLVLRNGEERDCSNLVGLVTDWEISTFGKEAIKGFTGKSLFAPLSAFGVEKQEGEQKGAEKEERLGSLRNDLESLFYVAITCAFGEASWARAFGAAQDESSMLRERSRFCLGREPFPKKWSNYLTPIRDALRDDSEQATGQKLLQLFGGDS